MSHGRDPARVQFLEGLQGKRGSSVFKGLLKNKGKMKGETTKPTKPENFYPEAPLEESVAEYGVDNLALCSV